jgi:RND family efflux transporter MFP subunit
MPLETIARRALLSALVAVLACGGGSGVPPAMPPTPVKLASVQPARVADATEYVASLRALRSTTVQPQVEGFLRNIYVKSGQRVSRGAALFQIDARQQQATVASNTATLQAQRESVDNARRELERARALFKGGAVSEQVLDNAETTYKTAASQLSALEAQLRESRVGLQYYRVTAPTAGVVGDLPVRVGDRVTPETMLTTIDENQTLELNVSVPIERAAYLRLGLPVEVLGQDGRPLARTTISFISPRVDPGTQLVLAKAIISGGGNSLRTSQLVRARVEFDTSERLVVPVLAVMRVADQHFVYVAQQDQGKLVARQRPVKVGEIAGDNYVVLEGLQAGDRVVVSGIQKIANGAPITGT